MTMILYSILASILFILFSYLIINRLYLKTNAYKNQLLPMRNICNGIPQKIKIVNFGSTYTMYAFNAYEDLKINGFSFAMDAQSLEIDNILLRKYANHIENGATVIFGLAACVPFYRYKMTSNKGMYYKLLSRKEIPMYSIRQAIKYAFPIGIKSRRRLKALLLDEEMKKNIVDSFPKTCLNDEAQHNMKELVDGWINMFRLKDLKDSFYGEENKKNLAYNTKLIHDMVSFCKQKNWNPVFVITPFSEILNQYFGNDFIKSGLYHMIEPTVKDFNIPIYDYRKHKAFQKDKASFIDGGFRMSKYGSIKFMRLLMNDINSSLLNNGYLSKNEYN